MSYSIIHIYCCSKGNFTLLRTDLCIIITQKTTVQTFTIVKTSNLMCLWLSCFRNWRYQSQIVATVNKAFHSIPCPLGKHRDDTIKQAIIHNHLVIKHYSPGFKFWNGLALSNKASYGSSRQDGSLKISRECFLPIHR
jgi:hypothetical protein